MDVGVGVGVGVDTDGFATAIAEMKVMLSSKARGNKAISQACIRVRTLFREVYEDFSLGLSNSSSEKSFENTNFLSIKDSSVYLSPALCIRLSLDNLLFLNK
ncbi:hypothetical protein [Yersinia rohdei]|uniref:hypothetical protein n=1 Tax=Yersinia rohdei TaxID=29485 RepID=UPI0021BDC1F8|nr:hypothetical protein [Yersinia rohdei]